jgi:hypothetical protein
MLKEQSRRCWIPIPLGDRYLGEIIARHGNSSGGYPLNALSEKRIVRTRTRPAHLRVWAAIRRAAIVLGVVVLTATNLTPVFCIEQDGATTENLWTLCCATPFQHVQSDTFLRPAYSVTSSSECARCLDMRSPLVGKRATSTKAREGPSRQPHQVQPKSQVSADSSRRFEDVLGHAATVAHPDLVALRTIRLLI